MFLPVIVIVKTLLRQIESELETAGRDFSKIRQALRQILLRVELSIGPSVEWEPEYREWLMESFKEALLLAQDRSVAREDYEQAAEIKSLVTDIQFFQEPSIVT